MMFRYMKYLLFKKKVCIILTIKFSLVWEKNQQNMIITEAYKVRHDRKIMDID